MELPFLPFDGSLVVSSTEALAFAEVPKQLVVIGAGSNLLFRHDFDGAVAVVATRGVQMSGSGEQVIVKAAAGENWHDLVVRASSSGGLARI